MYVLSNNKVYPKKRNVCVSMYLSIYLSIYLSMYLLSNKESYPQNVCVHIYKELPKQQQQ